MKQSIIPGDERYTCYLCKAMGPTEKHHIFGGANRKWSEKYGLFIHLCHNCHNEPPNGVHFNRAVRRNVQIIGQRAFEERCMYELRCGNDMARETFMRIFGKNFWEGAE